MHIEHDTVFLQLMFLLWCNHQTLYLLNKSHKTRSQFWLVQFSFIYIWFMYPFQVSQVICGAHFHLLALLISLLVFVVSQLWPKKHNFIS